MGKLIQIADKSGIKNAILNNFRGMRVIRIEPSSYRLGGGIDAARSLFNYLIHHAGVVWESKEFQEKFKDASDAERATALYRNANAVIVLSHAQPLLDGELVVSDDQLRLFLNNVLNDDFTSSVVAVSEYHFSF